MAIDYENDVRVETECGYDDCGHEETGFHAECLSCGGSKVSVYAATGDLVCSVSGDTIRVGERVNLNETRTGYVKYYLG